MTDEVFERIYRRNLWNGVESRSGPGSGPAATAAVGTAIVDLVETLHVESVLDVGCGDGFWTPPLPGYVGFDVSPTALNLAHDRHPFRVYTATLPDRPFDLVLCRDVVQHLPLEAGVDLLERIRATGSRMLLASTYIGGENTGAEPPAAYCPDLEAPPFSLGPAITAIFDGYHYHETTEVRDPRKYLGLWPLWPR